jgi:hypothetical protein
LGLLFCSNPYIIDKHFYKALDEVDDDFKYKKISIVTCVDVNGTWSPLFPSSHSPSPDDSLLLLFS